MEGQSSNERVDEMMREAQAWKMDIMDNYPQGITSCDIPMMILINKKDSETAWSGQDNSDLGHQEGAIIMTQEQLVDLATSNGFSSW